MAASFGRRQVQAAAAPRVSMAVAPPVETAAPVVRAAAPARKPPFVTIGLLVLLTLVFMWEVRASPVLHLGYAPPVGALVGFGAIDGALVRDGGWWRILTAPLLHANLSHLISNGVVLAVIGFMLEPLVGPRWFAALYAAGAVGGSLCSILLNAPDIPAVGASGAIMGVLAGAFLCGSSARAGPKGRRMQTWARRRAAGLRPDGGGHRRARRVLRRARACSRSAQGGNRGGGAVGSDPRRSPAGAVGRHLRSCPRAARALSARPARPSHARLRLPEGRPRSRRCRGTVPRGAGREGSGRRRARRRLRQDGDRAARTHRRL